MQKTKNVSVVAPENVYKCLDQISAALAHDDFTKVKEIVERAASDDANYKDSDWSLAHWCANQGRIDALLSLVNLGHDAHKDASVCWKDQKKLVTAQLTPADIIAEKLDLWEKKKESDADVFTWGHSHYFTVGSHTQSKVPSKMPKRWFGQTSIEKIGCSKCHSWALTKDSTLWVWGLADRKRSPITIPQKLTTHVSAVAAAQNVTLSVISKDCVKGYLYPSGQVPWLKSTPLQHATQLSVATSSVATHDSYGKKISSGNISLKTTYYALDRDHHLYAWGNGENGQLGSHSFQSENNPRKVPIGLDIASVASCASYCCALASTGDIFILGRGMHSPNPLRLDFGRRKNAFNADVFNRIPVEACVNETSIAFLLKTHHVYSYVFPTKDGSTNVSRKIKQDVRYQL